MTDAARPFGRRSPASAAADVVEPPARCPNCGGTLRGAFCHGCGQAAAQDDALRDHAREWADRWLRSDGVLWSTIVLLVLDPGRLTRDWWEGRRAGRMSPVRTLSLMLVGAALLGGLGALLGRESVLDPASTLRRMTWTLALTAVPVALLLLPRVLPADKNRRPYDHATAALYETAFQTLLLLALMTVTIVVDLIGVWAVYIWMFLSVPTMLGGLIYAVRHAVGHLRDAYGLERGQARRVAFALGMTLFVVQMLVSNLLIVAGLGPFDDLNDRLSSRYEGVVTTIE